MKAKKQYAFQPDYVVCPGETLQEVMESFNMSQKELAVRTGLTVQSLNRIFKGEQPLTYETANRLELATGVPARLWNNLESQYREYLAKIEERKEIVEDLQWLNNIPTKELMGRGYIKKSLDSKMLMRETLAFYGVTSVSAWQEIWAMPEVAARRSSCFESQPGPASAWIRQGELRAHKIECQAFDKALFMQNLRSIRNLTREEPAKFEPEMIRLCANAGVAVALVPEMKKVPWNGAIKWLSPRKAMILLSLRGKGEDKFWFSFFHEAGHVIHDSKKDLLINDGSAADPREKRANEFASEFLIPSEYNADIYEMNSHEEVVKLAEKLKIAPGIVAGRYQYLTKKWHYFKGLIRPLQWNNR